MLQGIYKGTDNSEILQEGKKYFLFPNGEHHYYVSPFNNSGAHTGCYQTIHFDLVEEEFYPELNREKYYTAELIHIPLGKYPGLPLKHYYLHPKKTHATFWEDPQLTQLRGCFPLEWFDGFEEFEVVPIIEEVIEEEVIEPEPVIEEPKVIRESEQLSLFDF